MGEKTDVWQGTLALMALKTLEAMGPLHGYGIARRIEQTSGAVSYTHLDVYKRQVLRYPATSITPWAGTGSQP